MSEKFYKASDVIDILLDELSHMDYLKVIQRLAQVPSAIVRCKDCEYFDLDHFENFRGFPLIVAHEICNRWGSGCKTDSNGFCFLGDRRSDE